jgi:hypothetical protein
MGDALTAASFSTSVRFIVLLSTLHVSRGCVERLL